MIVMWGKKKKNNNNKQLVNKIIFLLLSMLTIHSTLEHQSNNYNKSVCLSFISFLKNILSASMYSFQFFCIYTFFSLKTQVLKKKKV
jgi:hypothetical protein